VGEARLLRTLTDLGRASAPGGGVQAGERWKEVSETLRRMDSGKVSWSSFGWLRHTDPTLKKMVDSWAGTHQTLPKSMLIDPDKL